MIILKASIEKHKDRIYDLINNAYAIEFTPEGIFIFDLYYILLTNSTLNFINVLNLVIIPIILGGDFKCKNRINNKSKFSYINTNNLLFFNTNYNNLINIFIYKGSEYFDNIVNETWILVGSLK